MVIALLRGPGPVAGDEAGGGAGGEDRGTVADDAGGGAGVRGGRAGDVHRPVVQAVQAGLPRRRASLRPRPPPLPSPPPLPTPPLLPSSPPPLARLGVVFHHGQMCVQKWDGGPPVVRSGRPCRYPVGAEPGVRWVPGLPQGVCARCPRGEEPMLPCSE